MIRNYLKVAWRNLLKYRFYSGINILGMSVGIASVLLMALFVQHELSYDRYYEDAERLYRVDFSARMAGNDIELGATSASTGPVFLEEIPEVEDMGRFRTMGTWIVAYEDTRFQEEDLTFADPGIIRLFDLEFLAGNPETALTEPSTIVLTQPMAQKYFGEADPMGKVLVLDGDEEYEVTGVIKPIPDNTHFHFDFFASAETLDQTNDPIWLNINYTTYLKLREGASEEEVEAKFPSFVEKYVGGEIQQFMGISLSDFSEQGNHIRYSLSPVTDIHLHSQMDEELEANGSMEYVWIFGAIALFILVIACINFMNLATARSANRAKEVGIRKTLGSLKKQLVAQFMSEAFLLSLLAFVIGSVLAVLALPYFNQLSGKTLTLDSIPWNTFLPVMVGVGLFMALLAGSYPAFYLSAFRPIAVLKGSLQGGMKHKGLRSSLVVFQFVCSIALIVCTLVVGQQMRFIQDQNLGYNREQLVTVENAYLLGDNLDAYKEEMQRNPSVVSATIASDLPTPTGRNVSIFFPGTDVNHPLAAPMVRWRVDHDYIPTFEMNLAHGRNFAEEFATDSAAVLLNEAAMRQFQFTEENVIGSQIGRAGGDDGADIFEVVGVVENFFIESLRENIRPMIILLGPNTGRVTFRISTQDTQGVLADLEDKWTELSNGQPFNYAFLDDEFASVYENEERQGQLFTVFAGLAILIACLGLFGLAAFTAEQRTKEIGIRKVLGASVIQLVKLLSKEFMLLIVVAFVLASVLAGYLMQAWLADFAYHTNLKWWVFAVSGFSALLIAGLTMSYQSIRAAMADPVKSLRSE
ncbi:MAG: ABC transporter permease [Bacteroidota bacterium]